MIDWLFMFIARCYLHCHGWQVDDKTAIWTKRIFEGMDGWKTITVNFTTALTTQIRTTK